MNEKKKQTETVGCRCTSNILCAILYWWCTEVNIILCWYDQGYDTPVQLLHGSLTRTTSIHISLQFTSINHKLQSADHHVIHINKR